MEQILPRRWLHDPGLRLTPPPWPLTREATDATGPTVPPASPAAEPARERKPHEDGGAQGQAQAGKSNGRGKPRREKKGGPLGRPAAPSKHREPKRRDDVRTKDGRLIDVEDDPDTAKAIAAAAAAANADIKAERMFRFEIFIADLEGEITWMRAVVIELLQRGIAGRARNVDGHDQIVVGRLRLQQQPDRT